MVGEPAATGQEPAAAVGEVTAAAAAPVATGERLKTRKKHPVKQLILHFSSLARAGFGSRRPLPTFGPGQLAPHRFIYPEIIMAKSGLPVSQGDLYLLLPLAWQAYTDHLGDFADYKSGYTAQLATEQLKALADAQQLPDDAARSGEAEAVRQQLVAQLADYLAAWHRLDGYIEEAYPANYDSMRAAVGHGHYDAASRNDWAAVTALLAAARTFGDEHQAELLARGQMPATFLPKTLAAEATDVAKLLKQYQQLKGTAQQGTTAQQEANRTLYDDYQKLNRDAQRIFRRQPDTAKLFQTEYLLGLVRGPGQAGLRGTLTLADGRVAPGITVAVQGGKAPLETLSDAEGRYALPVPAGDYTVVFSGPGVARQEVPVTVQAGVKKRVDGVVGKGV